MRIHSRGQAREAVSYRKRMREAWDAAKAKHGQEYAETIFPGHGPETL